MQGAFYWCSTLSIVTMGALPLLHRHCLPQAGNTLGASNLALSWRSSAFTIVCADSHSKSSLLLSVADSCCQGS